MRHGETLFNLRQLNQGFSDSPLTENGIEQAKIARKYLEENNFEFDHFYCSTQERAEDTLNLITDREYTRDKRLKERNCGVYEGTHVDITPSFFLDEKDHDQFWINAKGETERQIADRLMGFMVETMAKEDHVNVLVVSHGTIIKNMLRFYIDESINYVARNCGIVHLTYEDGKFNFERYIDTIEEYKGSKS